jgi:hypothetical protein
VPIQVYVHSLQRTFPGTPVLLTGKQVIRRRDLKLPQGIRVVSSSYEFNEAIEEITGQTG